MNQTELGESIGIGQRTLSNYESGARKMPISVAVKLAEALGITVDEVCRMAIEKEGENAGTEDLHRERGDS